MSVFVPSHLSLTKRAGSCGKRRKPKLRRARRLHKRCNTAVLPGDVRALKNRYACSIRRSNYLSNALTVLSVSVEPLSCRIHMIVVAATHLIYYNHGLQQKRSLRMYAVPVMPFKP